MVAPVVTTAHKALPVILMVLIWSTAASPSAVAADAPPAAMTLRDAIGQLRQERDFAETGAGLLKTYAAQNPSALIKGQKLYAEAKAAFDGLIEQLLLDLDQDQDPGASAGLKTAIDAAAEKRLAFSRHVDAVVPDQDGAKNIVVDALVKGVGEIVKDLLDGGIEIWKEFRRGDQERRNAVATRVKAQRWRAFADVEPAI